ncbi:TPA: hypothetical protein ACKQCJ_001366 [Stenotrophomonas maltophilia]|uniref:hypothetical protein n=1 Tax=Stenotrophomonas maltophilia TaxID=40324 RepID=UPI0015DEE511|nr:hypothetical protein [Stenotrophomonas maltophilia]MBA0422015.1 hypothetical protein [Stenotrophomonas maltophilia]
MMRHKTQRDGWSTATQPNFVTSPSGVEYVPYTEKARKAAELRALVEAHIAAGGDYQQLPSSGAEQVSV